MVNTLYTVCTNIHEYEYKYQLNLIKDWLKNTTHSLSFLIIVHQDNTIGHFSRIDQPCWGELRTHYNDIDKPGDLHHPFPKGTPIALAVRYSLDHSLPFTKWLIQKSPWSSLFTDEVEFYPKNSAISTGIIFKDTKFDPTLLVSFLKNAHDDYSHQTYLDLSDNNYHFAYLLQKCVCLHSTNQFYIYKPSSYPYSLSHKVDLKRWFNNKPRNITIDHPTFYKRGAYNRVDLANIFCSKNPSENQFLTDLLPPKLYPTNHAMPIAELKNNYIPIIKDKLSEIIA